MHRREIFRQTWPALGILFIAPGVFSAGALVYPSETSHANGVSLQVTYESVVHLHEPTVLTLFVMNPFGNKGQFSIRAGKDLTDAFSVVDIHPEPLSIYKGLKETVYLFPAGGTATLTFTLMPESIGKTANTLQFGVDPPIGFSMTTLR